MKRSLSCLAGAQLPPQEVNSWGASLRFWVPNPKTPSLFGRQA